MVIQIPLNIKHTKCLTGNKKAIGDKIEWFCSNRDVSDVMYTLRNKLVTLQYKIEKNWANKVAW
jgi:hypothetical protein